jgi:hypothetical protein
MRKRDYSGIQVLYGVWLVVILADVAGPFATVVIAGELRLNVAD